MAKNPPCIDAFNPPEDQPEPLARAAQRLGPQPGQLPPPTPLTSLEFWIYHNFLHPRGGAEVALTRQDCDKLCHVIYHSLGTTLWV